MEEGHELFSNAMLAIVVIHVVGVIAESLAHHENLTYSMTTGHKQGKLELLEDAVGADSGPS